MSKMSAVRHVKHMGSLTRFEVNRILDTAQRMKKMPEEYREVMKYKTLLMLFEKPSLRTRLSFEAGTTQLGGHAIFYSIKDSPMGEKENVHDTVKCASRFVDIMMARVNSRKIVDEIAEHATIPTINALDDWGHPTQILADFQTIREHLNTRDLTGLRMAYVGDLDNNVTYDLARGCALMGMEMHLAGPPGGDYDFSPEAMAECDALSAENGGKVVLCNSAEEAVKGVDVVYADTFQSYHIPKEKQAARLADLMPYQVNEKLMARAASHAIFLHCLPASREVEVSSGVIDGPQSVVFDEAENRLHAEKALMWFLLNK